MNPAQIIAIINLLIAFGVPSTTVSDIQSILNASTAVVATTPTQIVVTLDSPKPIPLFGATQPMPPQNLITKKIKFSVGEPSLNNGVVNYSVTARYTENGIPQDNVPVTLTGSDGGTFTNISSQDLVTVDTATGNAGDPRGIFHGTVTVNSHMMAGEHGVVYAIYTPLGKDVTLTAEANGVVETLTGAGQR